MDRTPIQVVLGSATNVVSTVSAAIVQHLHTTMAMILAAVSIISGVYTIIIARQTSKLRKAQWLRAVDLLCKECRDGNPPAECPFKDGPRPEHCPRKLEDME